MNLLKLFCDVDDFWMEMESQRRQALPAKVGQQRRKAGLCASEIMTILIHFHQTGYRCFKRYYEKQVLKHMRQAFPGAVSYGRLVSLIPRVVILLWGYALSRCGRCTGISFVDSAALLETKSLPSWLPVDKARPAGFMASNCTWWSMTGGHPGLSTDAGQHR